jgi:hypothetical protein
MTPARRAEMRHYKQLAMTVEAQLQGWARKDYNNERDNMDSGDTMQKDTEHASSGHCLCTSRRIVNDNAVGMESTLTIPGNSAPLNSAVIKKLVPCNNLKPRTVKNANLTSGSGRMLGTFQQDILQGNCVFVMEPTQQQVVQNNSNETENGSVTFPARETEGSCLRTQDFSVQNSKIEGACKVSDRCGLKNMGHSYGFSLTDNVFGSDYIVYKPWDKVHNNNNNNDHRVKPCQENISGANSNQQRPNQVVTDNVVNGNLVQSAQRTLVKNGMHHCITDNLITPVIHSIKVNSPSLLSGCGDHSQKYGSGDNTSDSRSESVNGKVFTCQNEIHSENSLEHVELQPENSMFFLHSQKAEKLSIPVQDIPCLSKRAYTFDDTSKPVEIHEEVMDISKGLQSESCGNKNSFRFNTWESDGRVIMNKYSILKHSSPEKTEFSGLADVSSSTPHLLMHENHEDSISSAAMTSSTDLNHYMNITSSSSSGSPSRDAAALHNCKWSAQDVLHSESNMVALQKSLLTENSASGQNLQLLTSRESNFILKQSSLSDQTEVKKYIQNCVDNKLRTGLNEDSVCVVEELVVQNDLPGDLKVSSVTGCPVNVDCAVSNAKTSNEKNINSHLPDQAKCIIEPQLKFHHNELSDKHDNSETSAIPVNKCVHDFNNTEENVKKTDECGILKPEAAPPRLVRQNSYTLDSPSPILVAHMAMKKDKNSVHDMTESLCISPKPHRKSWDIMGTESNKKAKSLFTLANCECGSFNSSNSLIPSGLQSKSVSLGSAGTLEMTHDMRSKCILSHADLERFQTSISTSVEKDQNVADTSLYQDLLLHKTQSSSDMTALLEESSHENVSVKEVTQNTLQNCSPLRLPEHDSTEAHLLIYSSHPSITTNIGTQVLAPLQLDLLQKHNNDSDGENTGNKDDTFNTNCTVLPLSRRSPQAVSNIPAFSNVAFLGNMKHPLQKTAEDFSHSSVPDSPPVLECNSNESKDRQTGSVESHCACIRKLFPADEEQSALHHVPPLSISELENVSIILQNILIILG